MVRSERPREAGEPTLAQVMRRPRWIAALLLALAVAAGFAWLGRWQLGHAVSLDASTAGSEGVRSLEEIAAPGATVTDESAGMVVRTSGAMVAGDFAVVEERTNGGEIGAWVVGHFATDPVDDVPPAHLAVAIGWAPTAADAERALERLDAGLADSGALGSTIVGRYMPSDAAVVPRPDEDPLRIASMVPAQLVNLWAPFEGPAYAGYVVLHPGEAVQNVDPLDAAALADAGLEPIDSVPPLPVETVNWLNVFYAIEWIVFAGFAVFLWYRLVRDDWERIHELNRLAESEPTASEP